MRNKLITIIVLLTAVGGCASVPKETVTDTTEPSQGAAPVQQATYAPRAVRLFAQGNDARDNPQQAQVKYLEAVAIDPNMEPAWFNLARLYYANDSYDDLNELVNSDDIKPALSARIMNLLATSQRKSGQFNLAAETYQRALQIDENHLASLANLAILTDIYLHNPQAALEWYEKYQTQLDIQGKEDPRVKNWIADVRQRMSRQTGS